jgi:glycosyltransferase involved in cell wall biosynthesis
MKVVLIHDWLNGMRGGEKCLEIFAELFPDAPIFTLIHDKGSVSPAIEAHPIKTSFIQNIPGSSRFYRHMLPILPSAMASFDTSKYDLIISSSHCVAKMVQKSSSTRHWCYIYTPMRYVWELFDEYFGERCSFPVRTAAKMVAPYLRRRDVATARDVDQFVAISHFIAGRVKKHYERDSEVIYPPVSLERFSPLAQNEKAEDWDLVVSAFAPYKRIDLAVEASNRLKRPLKIIGSGQMQNFLKAKAGPQVEFLGWLSDEEIADHMRRCRNFVFPGVEDFGITPVEAQASGRPVVAFGEGGALETVSGLDSEMPSGVFFKEQTVDSLCEALQKADQQSWDSEAIALKVQGFSRQRFIEEVKESLIRFTGQEGLFV